MELEGQGGGWSPVCASQSHEPRVCCVCVYSAFSGFGLMMRCDTHWLAARGKGPSSTVSVNTGLIDV